MITELLQLFAALPDGLCWGILALLPVPLLGFLNTDQETSTKISSTSTTTTPTASGENSVATGRGAQFNTLGTGALQLTAGKGGKLNFSINQTSDPDLFKALLASQQEGSKSLTDAFGGGLQAILGSLAGLSESRQTGGESSRDKTILYIVAAIVAGLVLVFWKRR